jgi:hypothetical protein
MSDRRELPRILPLEPVFGTIGDQRVRLLDLSIQSARIAHRFSLGRPPFELRFSWDGEEIAMTCSILRTKEGGRGPKEVMESVLNLESGEPSSKDVIQRMMQSHVERALDEQKANAYGLPPRSTLYRQTAPRHLGYVRCELKAGRWRQSVTMDPHQPDNGFTISAQEDTREIELLCDTYLQADHDSRSMIRQMAQISVSNIAGVATRRFIP